MSLANYRCHNYLVKQIMDNNSSGFQENIYDLKVSEDIEFKDLRLRQIIRESLCGINCKILDVGCGDGCLLEPFVKGNSCFGVDVSSGQLDKANSKGLLTYQIDLERQNLPFKDDFFDLVVCSETIEHLIDIDVLMYEIHRVTKINGVFILTFPNVNQPISCPMQLIYDLPPRFSARYKSTHVRDYTLKIVRNILLKFDFQIEIINGTYIYPFKDKLSQFLANCFPRLSEKIIIRSRKHRKTLPKKETVPVIWNVLDL